MAMVTSTHSRTPIRPRDSLAAGILLVLLGALVGLTFFCGWVFMKRMERLYSHRVFPNVYALGVQLGGKTPAEATAELQKVAPYVDTGVLVLRDGERQWSYRWSQAGLGVDVEATVQAAYAKGRSGSLADQAAVWFYYHDILPRFTFDEVAAHTLLAELSVEASSPVVDPQLALDQGRIVLVPGRAGRLLDISATLGQLQTRGGAPGRVEISLVFEDVAPPELAVEAINAEAETLLNRQIQIHAYDVLTGETLTWNLGRDEIATWLYLTTHEDGQPSVGINQHGIRSTLIALADGLGDGRGFLFDEAAAQTRVAFDAGQTDLWLYLTHPERIYVVQSGDTLTSLSARHGMPAGLVAEANPSIDIDRLYVGQEIRIPSQDILTPHMPVPDKKIVVSVTEQRTRVYENGQLLYEWVVSTGLEDSPTHQGTFQVLGKDENAYASQWDLWMPYFVSVYPAGGGVINGFHELPILSNGRRLWAGSLGRPASYGCIILGIPDAEVLYNWAEVGVTVVIE
jgi:lipoprotein-anchoring transpeptidase ErfK/SrfK